MKFSQSYEIRFSEADHQDRLTPVSMYNLMQETAIRHSESVHRTADTLRELGYAWMLNRVLIAFGRYPQRRDGATVTTWAHTLSGLYAVREWTVSDSHGNPCARATSRWVLLDVRKRRAVRIPPFMAEDYGIVKERAIEHAFPRESPIAEGAHEKRFHVRVSDLDANRHANSACYVDWCLEAVPMDILTDFTPDTVELTYKKESVLGEELAVVSAEDPAEKPGLRGFQHAIRRDADGALLTIGRSVWRPRDREQG